MKRIIKNIGLFTVLTVFCASTNAQEKARTDSVKVATEQSGDQRYVECCIGKCRTS